MKQFLLLTLSVIFAIHVGAQQRKTSGVLGVKAAKVLDVRTGRYSADQMIWIDGDRIKAVGNAADIERQIPSGATIIDLSNVTILPGLVDCHVHLTSNPSQLDLGPAGLHISYPRRALIGVRNARMTLEAGFTTVRNVAADGYADVALRDAINEGDVIGPRMLVSGPALSITGGHWDENYLGPQFTFSKEGVADGVAAVMKQVRENVKYGADLIKVMATGGVVSEGDNPAFEQYSPAELKAIVETAHGLGRKVAAHAHASLGIKNAVLAGVDSIEHGSYATDEDIQLMKEHGTTLCPLFISRTGSSKTCKLSVGLRAPWKRRGR